MGNEGSTPTSEDEFESQARAPPSAVDPLTSQQQPPPPQLLVSSGRSGRMINAVFHRRQQQNIGQPAYPPPGAPLMQPEDMVMMSPEEQQQYYQEQQDLFAQQQQQQEQQYFNQNGYTTGESVKPAANGSTATPTTTPTKKPGLNFRPSGRAGAAILNSMKNLSLGSGRNLNKPTTTQDWETKWDEDEDSDEGEVDQEGAQKLPAHPAHAPPLTTRPAMDVVGISSPTQPVEPKVHLVTATPEQGLGEDGVEWDTGVYTQDHEHEKPNMQMFLPLLRVLGKGSFGKVCYPPPPAVGMLFVRYLVGRSGFSALLRFFILSRHPRWFWFKNE
jgi:hypothetical protein